MKIANPNYPLGPLPNAIALDISTIGDTVIARVPFGRLAEVLCFLDDAAIVAAVEFSDPAGRISSMPAQILDCLNELLTHDVSIFHPYYILAILAKAISLAIIIDTHLKI